MLWIILIFFVSFVRAQEICENGGIIDPSDNKCFHFIPVPEIYDDAKSICKNFYALPASIDSGFQKNFVQGNAKNLSGDYWIGLSAANNENIWKWADGHDISYTNWATGYPVSDPNKRCVVMQLSDGKWINVECNVQKKNFVCESIPKVYLGHCLSPSKDLNNKCNLLISIQQTYNDAEKICLNFGSQLISIPSDYQLQNIKDITQSNFDENLDYWIGLSDPQKTGTFKWSDGTVLNFTNWASGYPDKNLVNRCVASRYSDAKWYNIDCDTTKRVFLCQQSFARPDGVRCPSKLKYGSGPSSSNCKKPSDPNNLPPSPLELWFTKEIFEDLFPGANLGWGSNSCWPYSYESFVIAARYFPSFGTSSPNTVYTRHQNYRRDVATFLAHAVQETGENDPWLYKILPESDARNCFYKGGLFKWFDGTPESQYLDPSTPGFQPDDGLKCNDLGRFCISNKEYDYYFPCRKDNQGCYFGRSPIQIVYNYNYGQFQKWLETKNVNVDLLNNPNLLITKTDPPLAIMAALWFYMTPQPPKPAMHNIILGEWNGGAENDAAGFQGPIFGPTNLIVNDECVGEDAEEPGSEGENRRIKAFKWFCSYFDVPSDDDKFLTCKGMPRKLNALQYKQSYSVDWSTTWQDAPCQCAPVEHSGVRHYFDPEYYPSEFVALNEQNRQLCVADIYAYPDLFDMSTENSACLKFPPP